MNMNMNKNNSSEEVICATALLLSISKADDKIDNYEFEIIKEII